MSFAVALKTGGRFFAAMIAVEIVCYRALARKWTWMGEVGESRENGGGSESSRMARRLRGCSVAISTI